MQACCTSRDSPAPRGIAIDGPIGYAGYMPDTESKSPIARRFRGFLPVVVDVETAGFNPKRDALLEIAAVLLDIDAEGYIHRTETIACHVEPFPGANLDQASLEFTGIDPWHPFRMARPERDALDQVFRPVRKAVKSSGCNRAILVGHNAAFDLSFVNAAAERAGIKRNPFHQFSTFDTVTLAALAYGQTVLARAVQAAGMDWDSDKAHSAVYDTERTADLFCAIVNRWHESSNTPGALSSEGI
jgi:ribonuclease T